MGKVKLHDLHTIIDLMDEAISKTKLLLSISIGAFGKENRYMSVDFCACEMQPDETLVSVFRAHFYIGERDFNTSASYVKCKNFLLSLIKGEGENV